MQNKSFTRRLVAGVVSISILTLFTAWYIQNIFTARNVNRKTDNAVEKARIIQQYHAKAITLITGDGLSIAGLLVERPDPARILVICHGFRHTKEYMVDFIALFPHDTLLLIDFRGQGESAGQRISLGLNEHNDIFAAVAYVKTLFPFVPLVGIGISQGGAALLRAAAYGAPFDALISDSAPSDFKYTVAQILQRKRWIPLPLTLLALLLYEWSMGQSLYLSSYRTYAEKVTCPVLIFHDLHDTLIDYCHAEKIYNALGSTTKKLVAVSGTRHGTMVKQIPEAYTQQIEDFLNSIGIL